jgi:hypothetical protein
MGRGDMIIKFKEGLIEQLQDWMEYKGINCDVVAKVLISVLREWH